MHVSHLESAIDGTRFAPGLIHTLHKGRPLWVRYDLAAIGRSLKPEQLRERPPDLWRYRELLPLPKDARVVSLGEGLSPLVDCPRLARDLGLQQLWIKDESSQPTGSFKSRGMAVAVSMALHLGVQRLAVPSAGNAGGALAAYAARAGLRADVFMPDDTPEINVLEASLYGARVHLVNGLISDCGAIVNEGAARVGWFNMATLREPYRLEGKKTMGLELAEQFAWDLPEVILYPAGGGTGLIGMAKAFEELAQLGWLKATHRPRMILCQSDGCAPMVRAFEEGKRFAEPWPDAATAASGLRVPSAIGDFMMLDVVRGSGGSAQRGRESRIGEWMQRVAETEGISLCPEAAICFDVLHELRRQGAIQPRERVVVFNTGAAQKYVEVLRHLPRRPAASDRCDRLQPIDWTKFL